MNYALEIDAADVLGVADDATLQQLHDAYRTRAKKHHPDVGGEDWAFRIVSRAYELLSNARLQSRISGAWPWDDVTDEPESRQEASDPADAPPRHAPPPPPDFESTWVRPGVEDSVDHPAKVVEVELFTIRFELDGPLNLFESPQDRNLSSCLNVTWPAQPQHDGEPETPPDPAVLKLVVKAFEAMPKRSKANSSWSRMSNGRFLGWLSYPSANLAGHAFELFHQSLKAYGLGVRQLTRELFLARGSR